MSISREEMDRLWTRAYAELGLEACALIQAQCDDRREFFEEACSCFQRLTAALPPVATEVSQ